MDTCMNVTIIVPQYQEVDTCFECPYLSFNRVDATCTRIDGPVAMLHVDALHHVHLACPFRDPSNLRQENSL